MYYLCDYLDKVGAMGSLEHEHDHNQTITKGERSKSLGDSLAEAIYEMSETL